MFQIFSMEEKPRTRRASLKKIVAASFVYYSGS